MIGQQGFEDVVGFQREQGLFVQRSSTDLTPQWLDDGCTECHPFLGPLDGRTHHPGSGFGIVNVNLA